MALCIAIIKNKKRNFIVFHSTRTENPKKRLENFMRRIFAAQTSQARISS